MNEPNKLLALLFMGLVLFAVCFMAANARAADCPNGQCRLPQIPKVVKGEVSVVASRAVQPIRCPRELTCKPKCHKRFSGVVRRVFGRGGR